MCAYLFDRLYLKDTSLSQQVINQVAKLKKNLEHASNILENKKKATKKPEMEQQKTN
jgi:hypothetical protein